MKNIIKKYVSELDKGNVEYTLDAYALDAVIHLPSNMGTITPTQAFEFGKSFIESFPDLSHKIELLIEEGETVMMSSINLATHKGEFMGIEASGKQVKFEELMIFKIKDSKIVETWGLVDLLSLKNQIEN